jgi:hypothetical protein
MAERFGEYVVGVYSPRVFVDKSFDHMHTRLEKAGPVPLHSLPPQDETFMPVHSTHRRFGTAAPVSLHPELSRMMEFDVQHFGTLPYIQSELVLTSERSAYLEVNIPPLNEQQAIVQHLPRLRIAFEP